MGLVELEEGKRYENRLGGLWEVEEYLGNDIFKCRTLGGAYTATFYRDGNNTNPSYGPLIKETTR